MTDVEAPTDTVTVTVDGNEIVAEKGELVIAAAERNGVYIPRFCYHPRMSSVGMCRMCLVEIDTGRGPALQPSCMIECTDGMTVLTESPAAQKAQEGVLEFLLINHPLDCPVCDKGGECPLQDQTMSYGPGESRFVEEKRHYEKPIPVSDVVLLDRERCILCDRCTRFAKEVAGDPLIHFLDRADQTQVNTFPDQPFASYFSGNTVQICPVGALTATPFRFKARPWDLEEAETTCTGCSVGCRMVVQSSRNQVLRYQGVDLEPVNWGWLCDKGRFGFEAVDSDERLGSPLLRDEGLLLEPASWSAALERATTALQQGIDRSGPEGVAVLGGSRLTNEDAYAWVKLAKGVIGTDNVDCQLDDGLPAELVVGLPRATIDEVCAPGGVVLLIGPDPKEELPVLYLRLRHAILESGVDLVELSSVETATSHLATHSLRYRPGEVHALVEAFLAAGSSEETELPTEVAGIRADLIEDVARLLGERPLSVIVGRGNLTEAAESIAAAAKAIHDARPEVKFLSALRRANVHGAIDMGMAPGLLAGRTTLAAGAEAVAGLWPRMPSDRGLDAAGILTAAAAGKIDTLILLGADPLSDFPDRDLAERGLAGARTVIASDLFLTESVRQADVVLPAAGFAEVRGTTTNLEGRITTVAQKVTAPGTAQTDWVIAADISRRLGYDLGIESPEQVWDELRQVAPLFAGIGDVLAEAGDADGVVVEWPSRKLATATAASNGDGNGNGSTDPAAAADDTAAEAEVAVEAEADEPTPVIEDAVAPPASDPGHLVAGAAPLPLPEWTVVEPPPVDAYGMRLVATRKLYDRGTLLRHSESLVGLSEGAVVRLNPHDFERLGIAPGDEARVSSARTHVLVPVRPSDAVPRGVAMLHVNQSGGRVNALIDAKMVVTDVRVERP
ncbi:MAG TPA: NADH-quinone oxidoreductase subunit NuoG [Acidimicrobiales bacterium]|nr:NADH-quinone oxidoreductase subunit NuoG [Acidimicrobiales bacterium]